MISATSYTLVGVVNKFLTVLLNVLVWDKHSSPWGLFAVCMCLLAGTFYQQAPKRDDVRKEVQLVATAVPLPDAEAAVPLIKKDSSTASSSSSSTSV